MVGRKSSLCPKCGLAPVACKCGPERPGINSSFAVCAPCAKEGRDTSPETLCKACKWNHTLVALLKSALMAKR